MKPLCHVEVVCDNSTHLNTHEVEVTISSIKPGYEVEVLETFGQRRFDFRTGEWPWGETREKTVQTLKPVLEDAVKLAGRLAKNAGIDESAMTQALSQAYVRAVKVDRMDLPDLEETDGPCQEI
jgi:hypothetical protein